MNTHKISILQININDLTNKKHQICKLIYEKDPDVILIQETKLTSTSEKVEFEGYETIEHKRQTKGGGLLTATKKCYKILSNEPFTINSNEIIKTTIELNGDSYLNIINMYNPKSQKIDIETIKHEIMNNNSIIIGDLNCKNKLWGSRKNNIGGQKLGEMILNNSNDINHSFHHKPTHFNYKTKTEDVLDIALWNKKNKNIKKIEIQTLKAITSDHYPTIFDVFTISEPLKTKKTETIKLFHKYDWKKGTESHLSLPSNLSSTKEIDQAIIKLEQEIKNIYDEIPTKQITRSNNGLDRNTRKLINRKNKLTHLFRKSRNPTTKTEINKLTKTIQKNIKEQENKKTKKIH